MKKFISCIFLFFIVFMCYAQNNDEIFHEYLLDYNDPYDAKIEEEIGNLWCGYYKTEIEYERFSIKKFAIEKINIYTRKDNKFIFLGRFDMDGVYDKDNRLIISVPEIAPDIKILGYSSSVLDYRLSSTFVKERNGKISEMNEWANVWIDFENLTLKELDSFYDK